MRGENWGNEKVAHLDNGYGLSYNTWNVGGYGTILALIMGPERLRE